MSIVRKTTFVILIIFVLLIALPLGSAFADIVVHEEFLTTATGNDTIYGNNIGVQIFTIGTIPHDTSRISLQMHLVGDAGYGYIKLYETDSGVPTGSPIASKLFDTAEISTGGTAVWYDIDFDESVNFEADTEYAIWVQARSGDSSNYIEWTYASDSGDTDIRSILSTDGGNTWSADGGNSYNFKVWGESDLEILDAEVFADYLEDDDWLITIYYTNEAAPYYDDLDLVERYWVLQLLSGCDGNCTSGSPTVIAQSPIRLWGHRVSSIYLSADSAAGLSWGNTTDYAVRLYGNYGANPSDCTLLDTWTGSNMNLLDSWCIATAEKMGIVDDEDYTTTTSNSGILINDDGGVYFKSGIPEIGSIRGRNLFVTSSQGHTAPSATYESSGSTMETMMGEDFTARLQAAGDIFNLEAYMIGFLGIAIAYVMITIMGVPAGYTLGGAALSSLMLFIGMYTGMVLYPWIAIICCVAIAFIVWNVVTTRT